MKKRELDRDKLIQMYMSGAKHTEICDAFDICAATLREKIKEFGLPPRRKQISIDEADFRAAYDQLSSYKLAEKFGICRSTVARITKELGLRENMNMIHRTECYAKI